MNRTLLNQTGLLSLLCVAGTVALLSIAIPAADALRRSVYELAMADVVGSVPALLMRGIGFMLAGLLLIAVGVGLMRRAAANRLGRSGALFLMASGSAWALLGIFAPHPGDETSLVLTSLLMLLFSLTGGLALLLFAFGLRIPAVARMGLILAALLVTTTIMASSPSLPWPGLLERICIGAYFAAVVWVERQA